MTSFAIPRPDQACKLKLKLKPYPLASSPVISPLEVAATMPRELHLVPDRDPTEGGKIGLGMDLRNLAIEGKRMLIDEVLDLAKALLDGFSAGAAANIEQAVRDLADEIRKLFADRKISWEQELEWEFEKIMPEGTVNLIVDRIADLKVDSTQLASWSLIVHSTIDGGALGADIKASTAAPQGIPPHISVRDRVFHQTDERTLTVKDYVTIEVAFDGHAAKSEEMLKKLTELLSDVFSAVNEVRKEAVDRASGLLSDLLSQLSGITGGIFSTPSPELTQEDFEKITRKVNELFSGWLRYVRDLFREEKASIAVNQYQYRVYCVDDAEFRRLAEYQVRANLEDAIRSLPPFLRHLLPSKLTFEIEGAELAEEEAPHGP